MLFQTKTALEKIIINIWLDLLVTHLNKYYFDFYMIKNDNIGNVKIENLNIKKVDIKTDKEYLFTYWIWNL